jgi:hypothetical protein
VDLQTVRAGPRGDAETGSEIITKLGASWYPDTAKIEAAEETVAGPAGASPEARAAERDLAFEALIETGSFAESYSKSLIEAAWRGDRSTVEVHLRQLRACIITGIGIFKQLDGVEEKGGHS